METSICFCCEMAKFPPEKLLDDTFFLERKNEFYPDEEFGDSALVCPDCYIKLLEYYLNK